MTTPPNYKTIRNYLLMDPFFSKNGLDISYSLSAKKIFLTDSQKNDSKIEKQVSPEISPYDELVLNHERDLCKKMGESLLELKANEPDKDFSYEFKNGGASLKISR